MCSSPAWLALQQILINVCYPLNYLFYPDMLLTSFPSIQWRPELFESVHVFAAFTEGIVKKLKLHKTSGQVDNSVIFSPASGKAKGRQSLALPIEKH